MSPTTHLKFRTCIFAGFAVAVWCFLPSVVLAQPQRQADLVIENFSVYSTLPEAGGFRRGSISFTVVNRGFRVAGTSRGRGNIYNKGGSFALPRPAPAGGGY